MRKAAKNTIVQTDFRRQLKRVLLSIIVHLDATAANSRVGSKHVVEFRIAITIIHASCIKACIITNEGVNVNYLRGDMPYSRCRGKTVGAVLIDPHIQRHSAAVCMKSKKRSPSNVIITEKS